MSRDLILSSVRLTAGATTGGLRGFTHSVTEILKSVNEVWRFEGAITGSDTYTAANVPNLGEPVFYFLQNHGGNAMTVTLTHGGANSPDILTLAASGLLCWHGATEGALTSIGIAGTNGDEYTLILAD